MTNIRVHNPGNDYTKYYRYYNLFWDEFTNFLKSKFNVEENRYFEFAHHQRFPVKLEKSTNNDFLLLDCEYVIENLETGEFVIMSIADDLTHAIINEQNNPYLKKILISQFLPKKIIQHIDSKNLHKYSPWIYFQSQIFDLEYFYEKNKIQKDKNDLLFFKGTSLEDRRIIYEIDDRIIKKDFYPIPQEQYFNELIKHKIALSIDGRGEFCYRDIECFTIGIPIIRFEYESALFDNLIPNYHYISIPRPSDMISYRLGNKQHANLIMNKYYEVINDENFLNYISKNARKYYEKNLVIDKAIEKTYNLLNLDSWL